MAREGRKIKTIDPMNLIIPYIMPNRNGASNYFKATLDITEAEKFLKEKRLSGFKNISLMHVIMASYVRTVSQLPGINRFIRGQKIYARNSIDICLTIKKQMTLDGQETVIKISPKASDTLENIYTLSNDAIEENRIEGNHNGMDCVAKLLSYIPGIFLKFVVWFLKTLDYFGVMPKAIAKVSPFHGSMFITNMGSLGIEPIYHHLYDFGNMPVFISMGKKKNHLVVNEQGVVTKKRTIGLSIVCDERICDGYYYAKAFKYIKKYIENPWLLDVPPETVIPDIK